MGVTGLLPFLKNATRPTNIKEFQGQTVAIDSYCWLHKGAFSCADKLALGEKTEQYVYYCLKYVNTLLSFDIKPVMVFDGCHLPSKKAVEVSRRERRDTHKKKAAQLLREGKRSEARNALQLSIDITSEMALNLMNACRNKGVDCIVAPYEADAQLAYLNKIGVAQVIITEDSDLVLFGCEKVMYKMDFNGNGLLVESTQLNKTMDLRADLYSFEKFRYMCILSGCDYLASLRGIGLKKAMTVFQLTRQLDMNIVLKKIPTTLNLNVTVGPDYIDGFFRANNTFLYQLVYNPLKREIVPLNPYPEGMDCHDYQYAGPYLTDDTAYQLALGNLSVKNMKEIADFDPDTFQVKSRNWDKEKRLYMLSIWHKSYRPMSKIASTSRESKADVQRTLTKGKEVKVNLKLPNQQVKRQREPEDDNAALSENQLTKMYAYSTDIAISPAKRLKSDTMSSSLRDKNDKQMCELLGDMLGESKEKELKNFDHGLESPTEEYEPLNESVEHTVKSPASEEKLQVTKNKFRVSSLTPKGDFKLNAAKTEVVSRFFSSNHKPFKKTKFFDQLNDTSPDKPALDPHKVFMYENPDDPIIKLEQEDTEEDEPLGDEQSSTVSLNIKEESVQQSNYSPFGFKSKLNSFKSNFSKDASSESVSSSSSVCKQFKPVIDRHRLSDPENVPSVNPFKKCNENETVKRSPFVLSTNSISSSQQDSDNLPDLPDLDTNTIPGKLLSSKFQPLKKPMFYLDERNMSDVKDNDASSQRNQNDIKNGCRNMGLSKSISSPQSQGDTKKLSGCRSSGLSKSKASKPSKCNNENKQSSMKNFLTKFKLGTKDKLETTRKPLSPKRDDNVQIT